MNTQHTTRDNNHYDHVFSAWWEQVATAANDAQSRQRLLAVEPELLPKFAAQYSKLSTLPRRARRAMQRQWKRSLAGVALLLALGQASPLMAATINVGGGCTLPEAITAANTDTAGGGCTAGAVADRIELPANSTQTLTTVNNNTYGPTGLPIVTSTITIDGNNATIRRAATAPDFRIFLNDTGARLSIRETTISGGRISSNFNFDGGGGVLNGGNLSLTDSAISGNFALYGGGVSNIQGGTVMATRTTISGNATPGGSSGIYNGSSVSLTNSTISGNSNAGVRNDGTFTAVNSAISGNRGYGLDNSFGESTLTNSTISGNRGDGVFQQPAGSLTVSNSTISGNSARGVYSYQGDVAISNSTISGNSTTADGGGIRFNFGDLTVTNTTITRNSAARGGGVSVFSEPGYDSNVIFRKTLISGNSAANGREVFVTPGTNSVTVNDFNVFGFNGNAGISGFQRGGTDIVPRRGVTLAEVLNTTLANNGGPTRTHALPRRSPAVDAVSDGTCPPPARDQRGISRPRDGNGDGGVACDTGSFERFGPGGRG